MGVLGWPARGGVRAGSRGACLAIAALAAAAVLAALLALGSAGAWAAAECPTEAEQLGLAQGLLAEGDYFRAITELKRFLFLYPASPQADAARLAVADAFLAAGRNSEAYAAYAAFRQEHPTSPEADRALFGQAVAALKIGKRSEGRELLRGLSRLPAGNPYRSRAEMELALSLAEEGEWLRAQRELSAVSPPGPELERRLTALRAASAEAKSPAVAGLLSGLLPGAGQLYCGRPRDAGLALLVNGLFIWGAAEAGLRGNWPLAAGLSLVEVAWYGGTIYGAVNCAYKQQRALADSVREQLLGPPPQAGRGFMLAWECRF